MYKKITNNACALRSYVYLCAMRQLLLFSYCWLLPEGDPGNY